MYSPHLKRLILNPRCVVGRKMPQVLLGKTPSEGRQEASQLGCIAFGGIQPQYLFLRVYVVQTQDEICVILFQNFAKHMLQRVELILHYDPRHNAGSSLLGESLPIYLNTACISVATGLLTTKVSPFQPS